MAIALKKYKSVLLEEGLGNLKSCFYYTRQALESAVSAQVFEGKKCYADHPDAISEQTRPERSVRDIIGYFEGVHVEDGVAGQALLVGTLCMPVAPENLWAITLVESSIDRAGKFTDDFIGLSINASGVSSQIPLESFMDAYTLPVSAQPKLQKAKAEGVTDIEVCSKLTEAVSCDLVTEAGAKGRILKVLESEKNRMAKKVTNATKKKTKEADPAEDPKHGDADQDKELIKGMLKKYVGGDDHSDEEHEAMHQAMKHAKDMGMEGEEAEKCAGYSMKMAKHVASKQAEEGEESEEADESEESEEADESEESEEGDEGDDADGDEEPTPPAKKKSGDAKKMESEIIKLKADNAATKAELNKMRLEKHIDKTVRESGLPSVVHAKLRESIAKSVSEKEATESAKLFKEAYSLASTQGDGFYVNPEKTGGDTTEGFTLADCVKSS